MHILTKIIRVLWIRQYREAFLRNRVVASTEHDHILSDLAIDTIVDIGANRGQFALCVRHLFPRARIYSFEPMSKAAAVFQTTFRNDAQTTLINKAVGNTSGIASIHISKWDVSSSLLPIGQAQHDNFPFTEETRLEEVTVARLNECISKEDLAGKSLLKLDVQGFELSTLRGCDDLLNEFHFVYVEASFIELYVGQALATEVMAFLLANNFDLMCVANLSTGKSSRPIQADFLFSRRKLPATA
jgi:FkbM family methyltransferase